MAGIKEWRWRDGIRELLLLFYTIILKFISLAAQLDFSCPGLEGEPTGRPRWKLGFLCRFVHLPEECVTYTMIGDRKTVGEKKKNTSEAQIKGLQLQVSREIWNHVPKALTSRTNWRKNPCWFRPVRQNYARMTKRRLSFLMIVSKHCLRILSLISQGRGKEKCIENWYFLSLKTLWMACIPEEKKKKKKHGLMHTGTEPAGKSGSQV